MFYFLLCAYNEQKNIKEVIKNIQNNFNYDKKIIFVDDGSTDNTKDIILKENFKNLVLIEHSKNLGLGRAIRTGILYVLNNYEIKEGDALITLDADNTHPIMISNIMAEKFLQGYDIIIASRFVKNAKQIGVPYYRKVLSYLARRIIKTLFPYKGVKDYTSGYRLYSLKLLKRLYNIYKDDLIINSTFVVQLELLTKLMMFSPKITEVALCLNYFKKYGKSKLKLVKNILSYFEFFIINIFFKKGRRL
ncbi:MAG: glycosyltransferase family 2 protein [Endomicrobia bacterium]|nr:glycosyltransferase family 2 protein [Endomicrobiia bacterium]